MLTGASNFVHDVDKAFYIILGISFFFLIAITIVMIYFIIKYNRKKKKAAVQVKDNMWVETIWTVIPLIIVLLMFYYGWEGYYPMRSVPEGAKEIKVIGKMWNWEFHYPNGKMSTDLIVKINEPVKLNLVSMDVLHGLYIPAFRIKEDLVPGADNYSWFIPQQIGKYDIFCSVYCGIRHSYMHSYVIVVDDEAYDKMIADLPENIVDENNEGLIILTNNACTGCHSLDGSQLVGPTFKDLIGSKSKVNTDGELRKVEVDINYIKDAIYEPNKDVVEGYPTGLMQSYKDKVSEEDIQKIYEYLETLKSE